VLGGVDCSAQYEKPDSPSRDEVHSSLVFSFIFGQGKKGAPEGGLGGSREGGRKKRKRGGLNQRILNRRPVKKDLGHLENQERGRCDTCGLKNTGRVGDLLCKNTQQTREGGEDPQRHTVNSDRVPGNTKIRPHKLGGGR